MTYTVHTKLISTLSFPSIINFVHINLKIASTQSTTAKFDILWFYDLEEIKGMRQRHGPTWCSVNLGLQTYRQGCTAYSNTQ